MKNKLLKLLLFVIFISLIINNTIITIEIKSAINTFINILFPSIFPFFLISNLLINYNFQETLNKLFSKLNNCLFHTSNSSNFVIIMSLLSGFPSGTKYIKTLYDKRLLDINQANYLITFTHFANPLFVLVSTKRIFNSNSISYMILLSHILANIIIGILTRPKNKEKVLTVSSVNTKCFSDALSSSINDSIKLLIIILGNTCFFFILSSLLTRYLNLKGINLVLLNGFLDITKGITSISILNSNYVFKAILVLSFISFGGINIHMQVLSILKDVKIEYKNFLFGRISQVALSIIIFLLLINIH